MLRAVLSNLSELPRTSWCDFDLKLPALLKAAGGSIPNLLHFFPDNGNGEVLPARYKKKVGAEAAIYSVKVALDGNGTVKGRVEVPKTDEDVPFNLHPFVTDEVKDLIPQIVIKLHDHEPETIPLFPALSSNNGAAQTWVLAGSVHGFSYARELTLRHDDPVTEFSDVLNWSDRTDPRQDVLVDYAYLKCKEPNFIDFARTNIGPVSGTYMDSNGYWITPICGQTWFIDGSSLPLWGRMVCQPKDGVFPDILGMDELIMSMQAAAEAPVCGTGTYRKGMHLAHGRLPTAQMPIDYETFSMRQELEEILDDANRGWYAKRPIGCGMGPSATGDQEDFGAQLGCELIVGNDPAWIHYARYGMQGEFFRGYVLTDNYGKLLDPEQLPGWVTWSGYTHWSRSVSPNRIGKEDGLGSRRSTGWRGHDEQHVSFNNLATLYAATGDYALRRVIEGRLMTDSAMPEKHRIQSTRANGRLFKWWANCLRLCTNGTAAHTRALKQALSRLTQLFQGGEFHNATGDCKVIAFGKPDGRKDIFDPVTGDRSTYWVVWEHGLFVEGALALMRALPAGYVDQQAQLNNLVRMVCKTVVNHALVRDPSGKWFLPDDLWYPLSGHAIARGEPLPDAMRAPGSKQSSTQDENPLKGVTSWAFIAVLGATEVFPPEDDVFQRAALAIRYFTEGQDSPYWGIAKWWCVARPIPEIMKLAGLDHQVPPVPVEPEEI